MNAKRAELMGEMNFIEVVKSFYEERPTVTQEPANE